MIKFISPPDGNIIKNPNLEFLEILILYGESLYWNAGSGQASIELENNNVESYLTLTFDIDYGFQIEYKKDGEPFYVSLGEGDFETTVSPYVGGDPWLLPTKFFISREEAWDVVAYFCETGLRSDETTWGKLQDQNWNYGRT